MVLKYWYLFFGLYPSSLCFFFWGGGGRNTVTMDKVQKTYTSIKIRLQWYSLHVLSIGD
jgi:hypothetical protein